MQGRIPLSIWESLQHLGCGCPVEKIEAMKIGKPSSLFLHEFSVWILFWGKHKT